MLSLCSVGEVLEGIHITMPYSIASYMVRDFLREGSTDGTVDEELVGTLTGILVRSWDPVLVAGGIFLFLHGTVR